MKTVRLITDRFEYRALEIREGDDVVFVPMGNLGAYLLRNRPEGFDRLAGALGLKQETENGNITRT